jgi:hypothetical protein
MLSALIANAHTGEGRARREAEELWVERGHLVSWDTLREGPPGERSHLRKPRERSHLASGATWREKPWAWRNLNSSLFCRL